MLIGMNGDRFIDGYGSRRSYFLVEQSSCDCIPKNAVAVIDLSSGDISIETNRGNLFFKLSDASCDSIIRWKNVC